MRLRTRAQWGARAPREVHRIATPTPRCWVHHTGGNEVGDEGMRSIQRYHMDVKKWLDIGYSFVVSGEVVYVGRGAGVAGGHTAGDNTRSHAICVMGNFELRRPTDREVAAVVAIAIYGRNEGWWVPTLGGHRDAPGASTLCPGRHLHALLPHIRAAVVRGAQPTPTPGGDWTDMFRDKADFEESVRRGSASAIHRRFSGRNVTYAWLQNIADRVKDIHGRKNVTEQLSPHVQRQVLFLVQGALAGVVERLDRIEREVTK